MRFVLTFGGPNELSRHEPQTWSSDFQHTMGRRDCTVEFRKHVWFPGRKESSQCNRTRE